MGDNIKIYIERLGIEEETSEVLHLEHSFIWCWNLDDSRSRSETPGKIL